MRAEVADILRPHGEEAAVFVQRQLGARDQVAAGIVAERHLRPRAGPFHRPADALRRPEHERELGIERVARAVATADVARDHAEAGVRQAEGGRQLALEAVHALPAGIERVAPARRVIGADGGARLHRHAGHAVVDDLQPRDMGRTGEGRRDGLHVPLPVVDAEVARPVFPRPIVPQQRRVGFQRGQRIDHRRQGLQDHAHMLGGVLRLRRRLGHHHRDRLADPAHLVAGEQVYSRIVDRRAVAVAKLDILRVAPRRQRLHAVGLQVGRGQHRQHAGHRRRRFRLDRHEDAVRLVRAPKGGISLPGHVQIVGIRAPPCQQPRVLDPRDRGADTRSLADRPVRHRSFLPSAAVFRRSCSNLRGCAGTTPNPAATAAAVPSGACDHAGPSPRTVRTFAASSSSENGFCRRSTSWSSTPLCTMALRVKPVV